MLAHLTGALEAPSLTIRCQAIGVLGQTGLSEYLATLLPFLGPESCAPQERLAAIEALGMIGGDEAVDALLPLSADADLAVRWQAQDVLDTLLAGKTLSPSRRSVTALEEPLVRVIS